MESKKEFFLRCYKLGIIRFGRFTLKSGMHRDLFSDTARETSLHKTDQYLTFEFGKSFNIKN